MAWRSLVVSCSLLLTAVLTPTARADLVHLSQGTLALPPSLGERTVSGVAADAAGNVYVGARGPDGSFVVVFDPQGEVVRSFSVGNISSNSGRDGGCTCDELDLGVGPDGLLYVGQPIPDLGAPQDRYVSVYTTSGTFVRELTPDPDDAKFWIADLELDATGNVFVLVRHNGPGFVRGDAVDEVLRLDPGSGMITARFPLTLDETAQFESEIGGLALAPDGSIYVTTPFDGSRLIRFGADGRRLPAPPLDTIVDLKTRSVEDVDFGNDLLYVAGGSPNGMVAITQEGHLVDRVPGEARQLAIAGTSVYATKLHAAGGASARPAQFPLESRFAQFIAVSAQPPANPSGLMQEQGSNCGSVTRNYDGTLLNISYSARVTNCTLVLINYSTPRCADGQSASRPLGIYVGGQGLSGFRNRPTAAPETARFEIEREDVGDGGSAIVEWACPGANPIYELKGRIDLIDPSGNVLDRKTGRSIAFATVRLEYTPVRGSGFGTPSLALMRPQVNPQTTGADGAFAWDVAAGFWRLQVRAFGYKPFTTAAFEIPPEVTGLRLRLRRSRAYRKLIDPAGRLGAVRVGAKPRRRVAGLRVKVRRNHVREIVVRRRAFRTAAGIRLRSSELDLLGAYPDAKRAGRARRGARVLRFKRAFFTVRRGRVVAIRLARR